MATEYGTIASVTNANSGTVTRDLFPANPPIAYINPSLFSLAKDNKVTMNIDDSGPEPVATILTVVTTPVDPDFPADEGTLYVPVTGDLNINGITVTVKGVTVNGNVNITNGGKLILKSSAEDGSQRGRVTGYIDGRQNSTLIIYKSDVNGNVFFHNSVEYHVKQGSVGGDVQLHSNQKVKQNGSVGGDVDIKSNTVSTEVDGLTLTGTGKSLAVKNNKTATIVKNVTVNSGDVEIKNNQGCSYSNISTPNGSQDISGC